MNRSERLNFKQPVLHATPHSRLVVDLVPRPQSEGLGMRLIGGRKTIKQHHLPFMIGFGVDKSIKIEEGEYPTSLAGVMTFVMIFTYKVATVHEV